jgi:hypothetical protein
MKVIKIFNKDNKPMSRVWESDRPDEYDFEIPYGLYGGQFDRANFEIALEAWEQLGKDYPVSDWNGLKELISPTTLKNAAGSDAEELLTDGCFLNSETISKLQIKDGLLCLKEETNIQDMDKITHAYLIQEDKLYVYFSNEEMPVNDNGYSMHGPSYEDNINYWESFAKKVEVHESQRLELRELALHVIIQELSINTQSIPNYFDKELHEGIKIPVEKLKTDSDPKFIFTHGNSHISPTQYVFLKQEPIKQQEEDLWPGDLVVRNAARVEATQKHNRDPLEYEEKIRIFQKCKEWLRDYCKQQGYKLVEK